MFGGQHLFHLLTNYHFIVTGYDDYYMCICIRKVLILWVSFISITENGYVQKAVNYDGEMLIIEEIQVYENPEPISILRLSSSKVIASSL